MIGSEEVSFEPGVFLLKKATAEQLRRQPRTDAPTPQPEPKPGQPEQGQTEIPTEPQTDSTPKQRTVRITGSLPPEVWNRVGTKLIPKLRSGDNLVVNVDFSVSIPSEHATALTSEIQQILSDLGLMGRVQVR